MLGLTVPVLRSQHLFLLSMVRWISVGETPPEQSSPQSEHVTTREGQLFSLPRWMKMDVMCRLEDFIRDTDRHRDLRPGAVN